MTAIQSFEDLPLAGPVQRALSEAGYRTPTPIQAQAILPQLEGRDLMGCAQTGTGKTAAFALPILTHLAARPKSLKRGKARVLVLTPTRELAGQVGDSFAKYGQHMRLRHCLVYGGVSQGPQVRNLNKGVDILVATPGRLLDLLDQGHVDLDTVEFLVLDEVDRMLDMGFVHDVRKISRLLPAQRQTSLFSATMSREVEAIAKDFVHDPVRISIAPDKPVIDSIHQEVCYVRQENKMALLQSHLHRQKDRGRDHSTIVFCRTKHATQKLSDKLNRQGFRSDAIHGDKSQKARQKALDGFRSGRSPILIATDVAARGIDVPSISLVVNYDLPESEDSYVHRIGRTARAEAKGNAMSFCTANDTHLLRQIEKYIGLKINVDVDNEFHDTEAAERSLKGGGRGKSTGKGRSKNQSFRGRRSGPKNANRRSRFEKKR